MRPGTHWYEAFLRRNQELSVRMTQNLTCSRGLVTEEKIRNWFREIRLYLEENDFQEISQHPNADETEFFLSPSGKKGIAERGSKVVHNIINNGDKERITTLINENAAGELAPLMIVLKYDRLPKTVVALMPSGWGIEKSQNRWITGETFFEYICNIFHLLG
ncbi:hypothetical protein NQ314_021097 [Rhamnusium bicolor]|uniref:Transposase n=1 Tax=Rhamnusium bicolor TaxID=1586634 RepID=A0AAV8WKA4_9CUCU|nr:hypothetical protein NQ314_021097 [Rhamnusium bicolor]